MRTMSACCFTEYAKSPGCAMLLSFWIVQEELERKKDSGNLAKLWKSGSEACSRPAANLLDRHPHGHSAGENKDYLQHDGTQPDAQDHVLLGVLKFRKCVVKDIERDAKAKEPLQHSTFGECVHQNNDRANKTYQPTQSS